MRLNGSRRIRLAAIGVGLPLIASAAVGCVAGGLDFTLVIRNDTQQTWLLRYTPDQRDPGLQHVEQVDPGANTYAASWVGAKDRQVELLDLNCTVMGIFQSPDGTNYSVPGVEGMSATVRPYSVLSDAGNPLGVASSRDCGGWVN